MSRLSGTVSTEWGGAESNGENITKLSKKLLRRPLMIDVPKLTLDKGKVSINRNPHIRKPSIMS